MDFGTATTMSTRSGTSSMSAWSVTFELATRSDNCSSSASLESRFLKCKTYLNGRKFKKIDLITALDLITGMV